MTSLGSRRHLVTFKVKATERNDVEGTPAGYDEHCKAYCGMMTEAGGETLESGQQVAEARVTLDMHWTTKTAGITADMLAVLPSGRELAVVSAINTNGENVEMVVTCKDRGKLSNA